MKTKWGSCNHRSRTIRLNTGLLKEPKDLLEYVVVHEMPHLIAPTHSEQVQALITRHYSSCESQGRAQRAARRGRWMERVGSQGVKGRASPATICPRGEYQRVVRIEGQHGWQVLTPGLDNLVKLKGSTEVQQTIR